MSLGVFPWQVSLLKVLALTAMLSLTNIGLPVCWLMLFAGFEAIWRVVFE